MENIILRILVVSVATISMMLLARALLFKDIDNSDKLIEAIKYTDFTINEAELNVWGEYIPKYMSEIDMQKLVSDLADSIGISEFDIVTNNNSNSRYSLVEKNAKEGNTKIELLEMINQLDEQTYTARNYLSVTIRLNDKCNSISHYEEIIKEWFSKYGIEPITHLTLDSCVDGRLTLNEKNKIVTEIFSLLSSDIVETYSDEEILSIYGYTQYIDDYIVSNGKKINMNVALTYNETENKTYLYTAIPVITTDY
jgi:uncharacterized protein YuzB (UPF0349 family)